MFIDASAIVAVLTLEAEADALADILEHAGAPITSPIAIFESVAGICRKRHASVSEGKADLAEFLAKANIMTIAIGAADVDAALEAFSRYGKGRGHPAQLNMGDCFSYAMATSRRVPLLFKGEDFAKTDVEVAAPRLLTAPSSRG